MDEDMIQLRLDVQKLFGEMRSLRETRNGDRSKMDSNHVSNRTSIHDIRDEMQTLNDTVTVVTGELHDYLLVQATRDEVRDKAWWKAPLGVAIIVLVVTIGWSVVQKAVLHW